MVNEQAAMWWVAHRIIESPQVPCTGNWDFLGLELVGDLHWDLHWDLDLGLTIIVSCKDLLHESYKLF